MREFRTYGSVRGVRSNAHPYRDQRVNRLLTLSASAFPARPMPLKDTPEAGGFRSWNWREVHEPVHVLTIGKKPYDSAGIVDPIDESTHHAECCSLRRAGGIVIVPISPVEDKTMHSPIAGDVRSDNCSVIIAAEGERLATFGIWAGLAVRGRVLLKAWVPVLKNTSKP
jgi:hypothetical protein